MNILRRLIGLLIVAVVPAGLTPASAAPVSVDRGTPWTVATSTPNGIASDYRMLVVDHAQFRVFRLYPGTSFLHWHVGSQDPPVALGRVPADANSHIDLATEGRAGIIGVFNGGFKQNAHVGGAVVDGLTLSPLLRGMATIALDRYGHWEMGAWGQKGFPTPAFSPVSVRQNLPPLVSGGVVASSAVANEWGRWGDPLHGDPVEPRSGLGVDRHGNLLYLAPIKGVLPRQLGDAMVAVGVRFGMELDMNPYWPTLGGSVTPLHAAGPLPVQIPNSSHDPAMYFTNWERDFFVASIEPSRPACQWVGPGLVKGFSSQVATPQPLHVAGTQCATG